MHTLETQRKTAARIAPAGSTLAGAVRLARGRFAPAGPLAWQTAAPAVAEPNPSWREGDVTNRERSTVVPLGHEFGRIPVRPGSVLVQPKLKLGQPGDTYEQEADRVADQVMGVSAPQRQPRCSCGSGCPRCKAKASSDAPSMLQARHGLPGADQTWAPAHVTQVLRSTGSPLAASARAFFEPRFGHDFSQVRVHTGAQADAGSRAIGARAFTHGSHIVFADREYRPDTQAGKHLLAHELTHVIHQSGSAAGVQRSPGDEYDMLGQAGREEDEARQIALDEADGDTSGQVYMCAKDLDTAPVGRHAFFRIGGPGKGNPTISLQPIDASLGADCWQGVPDRDYPSDVNADADCDPVPISVSALEREFHAYPVGHYCTWGPNSNTFVGEVARNCGIASPDPSGWTPGIDESPPPSGTFAPDKWSTLAGCETKICSFGRDIQDDDTVTV